MLVKNVEKKENSSAIFQVEVDKDAFDKAIDTAYRRMRGSIYVAGFRKGKAPRTVIEGMYGKDVFHEEAVNVLAPDAFDFGVKEAELKAVGTPAIVDFNMGEDGLLTITFRTDVYPEVTLGEYKGLKASWTEPVVTEEQLAAEIYRVQKQNARFVDVERPVQQGDTIVFDFEGFVDGVAFPGGQADDYSLEIGSGSFIPGFEEQLVGMSAEQPGEVHVTFPEQYNEELGGKDATFKVLIHSVREPQYPELDDEFAKDVSEFDTFEEYKADVRAKLLEKEKDEAEREFKSELMNQALESMSVSIPASLVDEKMDEFLRSWAGNVGIPAGMKREDVIKAMGLTEESFNGMMRPIAHRQVQSDLMLDKIAEVEGLQVSEEEKEEFYKQLEADYGEDAEQIKAMIDESLMLQDTLRRKAAEVVYGSAVRTEPAPVEEKAEEKPVEEAAEDKAED